MKRFVLCLVALTLMFGVGGQAMATIISAVGPVSSAGALPSIIGAPATLLNSVAFNTGQEGFDERQNVLLAANVITDQGVILAGTQVNSHMIFLNKQDGVGGVLSHFNVTWTFANTILGTMSDTPGNLEAASTPQLGAVGSIYGAPFSGRGLEGSDTLNFVANTLTLGLGMQVTQPGDWIRVVTAGDPIPEPSTYLLFAVGILGIIGMGYRQRKKA